jgi:hypothetical protein
LAGFRNGWAAYRENADRSLNPPTWAESRVVRLSQAPK